MANLKRLTKTASKRIRRNPYNALGAILVMYLTFFVGGIFILVTLASNSIIQFYETKPNITGFLKDDTTKAQIDDIKNNLQKISTVKSIKYVSKADALNIYKERNKSEPALLEFVTADILPSSVEVSGSNINEFDKIATSLKAEPQIAKVVYYQEIINTLIKVTGTIRWAGLAIIGFLMLTSIIVTLVVIGLNISLHQEEIEIMKLVGATKWYVRTPFLLEGIFYGFASAFLAVVSIAIAYPFILPIIERSFSPITLFPSGPLVFLYILAGELFVGFLIGTIGAWIATRKYLEV